MKKVELNVKSYAVLFSHLSGFAAINAWGSLQQSFFKQSSGHVLIVVPIGLIGLFMMYTGYGAIRDYIARMDDGEKDEFEEKWNEETEESEHDVAGLSLSFLTVQALRFKIGGVLPNQEGIENDTDYSSHGGKQWHLLCGSGVIFFILSILVVFSEERLEHRIHKMSHHAQERVKRMVEILNNYFTFAFAWCVFYGVKWAVQSLKLSDEHALMAVVLALLLSAMSFAFIFGLDAMMDNKLFGEDSEAAGAAAEKMITALGILIGFSWEQCFDTAVTVIAEGQHVLNPAISKLLMSILLVLIVFPAWRGYILPTEQALLGEDTEAKYFFAKALIEQRDLFNDEEHAEARLDMAHLKLKHYRRMAHNTPHPAENAGKHLTHLRVTTDGITEVEAPSPNKLQKKATHMKELTHALL